MPEKAEKKEEATPAIDVAKLLTDEVKNLIEHPLEQQNEDGAWFPVPMLNMPPQTVAEFDRRFKILREVREKITTALEQKKDATKQREVNAEVRARIMANLTEEESQSLRAMMAELFVGIDELADSSDAAMLAVSDRLAELSGYFRLFANETVHLNGVPDDLREQSREEMIVSFNEVHDSLNTVHKAISGLFKGLENGWAMYAPMFDKKLWKIGDGGKPVYITDGRAISKSKYAYDEDGEAGGKAMKAGHRKLDIIVGYRLNDGDEIVRNLATDYRTPGFSLPNFTRELNRFIVENDPHKGAAVGSFPITVSDLARFVRDQTEITEKDDLSALNSDEWEITIPGTEITVRRVTEESEAEESAE